MHCVENRCTGRNACHRIHVNSPVELHPAAIAGAANTPAVIPKAINIEVVFMPKPLE
jgi:hypothetical protein